tara:strand:- start:189 stop:464 length:276 start_codon:yes stop_codon:yes gene_type:complete
MKNTRMANAFGNAERIMENQKLNKYEIDLNKYEIDLLTMMLEKKMEEPDSDPFALYKNLEQDIWRKKRDIINFVIAIETLYSKLIVLTKTK